MWILPFNKKSIFRLKKKGKSDADLANDELDGWSNKEGREKAREFYPPRLFLLSSSFDKV